MFYEHDDDKYIPLKIILKDVVGYYNVYKDNDSEYSAKTMNLKLGDDLLDKVYDIFEHIKKNYEKYVKSPITNKSGKLKFKSRRRFAKMQMPLTFEIL